MGRIFINFAKGCILHIKIDSITKFHPNVFFLKLYALESIIKDVSSRLYCCHVNLMCHEHDNSVFTNDRAFFLIPYMYCSIN